MYSPFSSIRKGGGEERVANLFFSLGLVSLETGDIFVSKRGKREEEIKGGVCWKDECLLHCASIFDCSNRCPILHPLIIIIIIIHGGAADTTFSLSFSSDETLSRGAREEV